MQAVDHTYMNIPHHLFFLGLELEERAGSGADMRALLLETATCVWQIGTLLCAVGSRGDEEDTAGGRNGF